MHKARLPEKYFPMFGILTRPDGTGFQARHVVEG
jgi:hypothetical protein